MSDNNQKTAIIFPGQGAQFPGMGRDLYENSPAARKIFDAAESLRKDTILQCFDSSKEELSLTVNTQPCIFTVSMASAEHLKEQGTEAFAVAGFSAGELAALTFAGVFTFDEGFKAICKRAELMQACAEKNKGAMAAVLKLDYETVLRLCEDFGVYAVNFNCPGQIVVSGKEDAIKEFCLNAAKEGGRILPLAVNGAFHSPLMSDAAVEFSKYLNNIEISAPKIPVYANMTAKPYAINSLKETLSMQIEKPVLWQQTIENMLKEDTNEFVEAEPGKVLTGLINKIRS